LIRFRRVDAKESDAFRADHERIAINHACKSRNTARTVYLGHGSLGAIRTRILVEHSLGSPCHLLHGRADAIHQRIDEFLHRTYRMQEVRPRRCGNPSDQEEHRQQYGKNSIHGTGSPRRPGAKSVSPAGFRWECGKC